MARRPLRWIDSPLLDLHNKVGLTYQAEPNGLPTGESLAWLRALEDSLVAAAGPGAELLAHETHAGRRVLHVYSDSEDQNVTARIDELVSATPGAAVDSSFDPAWRAVRHLA
nr:DUF695 domain-containing protein [Microlunatus antarcticus]